MRLKLIRARDADPYDVIRVDGVLHVVVSIEWGEALGIAHDLEPLADVLARAVRVSDRGEPVPLWDLLVESGWTPPS